jgi:hypothetical protein
MEGYNRTETSYRRLIIHFFFIVAMTAVVLRQTVGFLSLHGLTIAPLRFPVRLMPPQTAAPLGTIGLASVAPSAQA